MSTMKNSVMLIGKATEYQQPENRLPQFTISVQDEHCSCGMLQLTCVIGGKLKERLSDNMKDYLRSEKRVAIDGSLIQREDGSIRVLVNDMFQIDFGKEPAETQEPFEKINGLGEWAKIDPCDCSWEYQPDLEDGETYMSGNFIVDDDDDKYIIDYDGCYELPAPVILLLESKGYNCSEVK